MRYVLLLCMLFAHVFADFNLQGCLADMKQKAWWKEFYPEPMYAFDYVIALIIHSFGWAFCIIVPAIGYMWIKGIAINVYWAFGTVVVNTVLHAIIDHYKCNTKTCSLVEDQVFHILQVVVTYTLTIAIM